MKKLFLLLTVFLIGCSSPKVGDWYEHNGTKGRIKIFSIGMGYKEREFCVKFQKDINKDRVFMLVIGGNSSDSLKECFTYSTYEYAQGKTWYVWYIRPVDLLKEDYRKIE
jgi:hypothetical protein